jgi:hypothetical protein
VARRRLVYQNWLVELGFDPKREGEPAKNAESSVSPHPALRAPFSLEEKGKECECSPERERAQLIETRVQLAMEKLTSNEREIVERIHYMGQTYREISEKSGRAIRRLELLHSRAIRRLRKELRPLVKELYGIEPPSPKCAICRSPMREEIDRILDEHDVRRSLRTVMRQLRDEYGLLLRTPHTLIGHKKYH